MEPQAFDLLKDKLNNIENDIRELRGEIRGYQRANNDVVSKLKINVAKLMVVTGLIGVTSGGVGHTVAEKVTPYFKKERVQVERPKAQID